MKDTITSHGVTFRRPVSDEKTEQASIRNLVLQIGGVVYTLGTVRATACGVCGSPSTDPTTRQTPGIADLAIFLPPVPRQAARTWTFVWLECKGRRGVISVEQLRFRQLTLAARVVHLVGGVDEFVDYLERGGWLGPGGT